MRCPQCEKFTSLEMGDPELESINLDADLGDGKLGSAAVTATVRIVRTCGECGDELKEATLELEGESGEIDVSDHASVKKQPDGTEQPAWNPGCELQVEEEDVSPIEEGGGRYKKSYFGATVSYKITCACQKDKAAPIHEGELSDKVAASAMEELT